MNFPFYKQTNTMDCGTACLRMIAKYYGKYYNTETLRQKMSFGKEGVSMLGISEAAEKIGFRSRGVQLTCDQLCETHRIAMYLHWQSNHFVVLIKAKKNYRIADPSKGIHTFTRKEFLGYWSGKSSDDGEQLGLALLLEPTPAFFDNESEKRVKIELEYPLSISQAK